MTTGEKIKALRKQFGLTQTELGEKLGVKKNAVSKWECGRVDDIPKSKIKAMCVIFGVPTSYLVDEDNEVPEKSVRHRASREDVIFALSRGREDVITDEMFEEVQNFYDFVVQREARKTEFNPLAPLLRRDQDLRVASPVILPTARKKEDK